jgi:hypothetical protein
VEFKTDKEIRLALGFEAQQGCRFWAHIAGEDTCRFTHEQFNTQLLKKPWFPTDSAMQLNTQYDASINQYDTFKIHPNPTHDILHVSVPGPSNAKAIIYTTLGKEIIVKDVSYKNKFDVNLVELGLANGMYILVVYTPGIIYKEKILFAY